VQPESRRQGVWAVAGTPATLFEMFRGFFASSRQILVLYIQ